MYFMKVNFIIKPIMSMNIGVLLFLNRSEDFSNTRNRAIGILTSGSRAPGNEILNAMKSLSFFALML